MNATVSPKKTLLIIAICAFLQSISIIITPEFYLGELIKNFDISNEYFIHIKLFLISCGVLGISISVLTYTASTLEESSSKVMLKGVFIVKFITFLILVGFLCLSPLKPTLFIVFLTLIFSIFAYSFSKVLKLLSLS